MKIRRVFEIVGYLHKQPRTLDVAEDEITELLKLGFISVMLEGEIISRRLFADLFSRVKDQQNALENTQDIIFNLRKRALRRSFSKWLTKKSRDEAAVEVGLLTAFHNNICSKIKIGRAFCSCDIDSPIMEAHPDEWTRINGINKCIRLSWLGWIVFMGTQSLVKPGEFDDEAEAEALLARVRSKIDLFLKD